ncbi:hypothetical protein BDN67DRAFT_984497, partial [Paxillus ammoniavirescens]
MTYVTAVGGGIRGRDGSQCLGKIWSITIVAFTVIWFGHHKTPPRLRPPQDEDVVSEAEAEAQQCPSPSTGSSGQLRVHWKTMMVSGHTSKLLTMSFYFPGTKELPVQRVELQNRLATLWYSLKKKYRDQAHKFHQTGNGVAPKEISEGDAEYNNLLDAVLADFPWFSDLHGLWKGIPLFSPKAAITATPGVCHGAQLLSIIKTKSTATSDDSPLLPQTPAHTMAPPHFDNNSPSLHDHTTPSTDKGKGRVQAMDDSMMEFDYGAYSDNNEDDAGLAQGDMDMEVDEDELVHDGFIGGQKCQHPHSLSPPLNPTFIPPEKSSTPITDNHSTFRTGPTAGTCGHATPGPPLSQRWLLHSLQLISAGNSAKRAKTSGAGHHIQTILDETDTVRKDKVVALELKNDRLHIKLDHEHHRNEQAFTHEERTSEQANAAILHQRQTEKLEAEIHLQDAEARTYERKKKALIMELEVMKLHQSLMSASQNPTKAQATTGRGRGVGSGSGGPAVAESSTGSSGQLRVHWKTMMVSGHTSKLVRWLADHPVDYVVLFSGDKGAPRPEGRASESIGDIGTFPLPPFTYSITRLRYSLKKKYCDQARKFHQTGNGVAPKEISEGDAEYNNLLGTFFSTTSTTSVNSRADAVLADFPWFSDLHGLWKGIPLFSPKAAITATPSVRHGAQLLSIIKTKPTATSDDSPLPPQTPTHTVDDSPLPPTDRKMAPPHFDNNSPSLHDHTTPSTDKGKGRAQAMDDLMMEFDYGAYSDNNKDDAGLAQGDMDMEMDKDELVHDSFIGGQKHQHPHSPSPPPNPTFIPPEKPSTPITDNHSAFHTRPTAGTRGHATPGPPLSQRWLLHSLQLISAGNSAKRAKTSGAGHHIQTILDEADT